MNRVSLPTFDDAAAFLALSSNSRLKSYPELQAIVPDVLDCYDTYMAAGGDPALVNNVILSDPIAGYLRDHYASPPRNVAYIRQMRDSTEHLVCPMCGSMHSGTLDHFLPKSVFPIFALFSKNLVPACKCNSKRNDVYVGATQAERVLHPYFDNCLEERLVRAQFDDVCDIPRVSVALAIPNTHPYYPAVNFHVRSIVERSAIVRYLADRWSALYRKPSLVIRALGENPPTQADLAEILEEERVALDDLHTSRNNWNSVFVSGLLQPHVLSWLMGRFSDPERAPDGPLG
ncbi:HNH endonuclease [Bradyrhizobium amphicarpaeae]|uniref:HNH endonuclease n=1 Tax=Bradyrhizobium amphicarpaeae TaxID=1404768 RepID=UPI0011E4D0CD|nr:hypothetical protein [Bradyrhizobium amphicarpaeae]